MVIEDGYRFDHEGAVQRIDQRDKAVSFLQEAIGHAMLGRHNEATDVLKRASRWIADEGLSHISVPT